MRIKLMVITGMMFANIIPDICLAENITTPTGFYYPVGTEMLEVSGCGQWLERPSGVGNDCYLTQEVYHIGVDMVTGNGTYADVRAIADGEVIDWSDSSTSGWSNDGTNNNIALLMRHHSVERGDFVALYGHVLRNGAKPKNSQVKAGEVIAHVGHWNGGDHLHFGIVNPTFPGTPPGSYGRWLYSKYGVQGNGFYDNGFIDPIDFIVHNGPDNYITRQAEPVPDPITTKSSWFPPLCWQTANRDARCDADAYISYLECTLENNSLCADAPSTWSALASSGKGSGPGGGDGGGSYNLNQDTDIMDPATNTELIAGTVALKQSQTVNIRVQLQSEGGDVWNYMDPGKDAIETDVYVRIDSGSWAFYQRKYTQASNLGSGTHTETVSYTVPNGVSEISFRAYVDAEDEVNESKEGDNWSRIETFRIENYAWLFQLLKHHND